VGKEACNNDCKELPPGVPSISQIANLSAGLGTSLTLPLKIAEILRLKKGLKCGLRLKKAGPHIIGLELAACL
jgi:hypothetical protein